MKQKKKKIVEEAFFLLCDSHDKERVKELDKKIIELEHELFQLKFERDSIQTRCNHEWSFDVENDVSICIKCDLHKNR